MEKLLLLILLYLNIIIYILALKCDENTIEHCIECNSGENAGSCSKCENKYFLFFNNLMCIPCNDNLYGQTKCSGTCDATNLAKNRIPFCEQDGCVEGSFNLNGICMKCSDGSEGCSKCTYNIEANSNKRILKCLECINNQYILLEKGECLKCFKRNCKICHYENNTEEVCDVCEKHYYISSDGECKHCYNVSLYDEFNKTYETGKCEVCSDNQTDYKSGNCWCNDDSAKTETGSCFKCPDNCFECEYNNITKKTECINCYANYTIDPDKNCSYCGYGCEYCFLDNNLKPICTSCLPGTVLKDNQCLNCPNGCTYCKIDESSKFKNEIICTKCNDNYYTLTPDNKCKNCLNISDTGEGCYSCAYNKTTKKYDCLQCIYNYVYINNLFKCAYNRDYNNIFLYGCYEALYDEKTGEYKCIECSYGFIQPINEKVCRERNKISLSYNCLEIENIGNLQNPIFSCHKCNSESTLITNIISGKKNCYERNFEKDKLSYCLEGEIDNFGNLNCTKCIKYASLDNSGKCKCDSYSFGKDDKWCYKCDDMEKGNPGCLATKGCSYTVNVGIECEECKEGYYKEGNKCYSCMEKIFPCDKCHKEVNQITILEYLTCDNCIDFYSPNKNGTICQPDECEEYPEIAPGCIICKDKLNEYKNSKKCQSCKYGYFKTKEDLCVYCRSEAYGGLSCYECGYEENEKGEETNNIICKDCYSYDDYHNFYYFWSSSKFKTFTSTLSPEGKCYNCQFYLSDLCLKCEFKTKLICTLCIPGYYLDSQGNCISLLNKITMMTNCEEQFFSIDDNSNFFLYDKDSEYAYKYNYNYNPEKNLYFNFYEKKFNHSEYNEILRNYNFSIKGKCQKCKTGYYYSYEGKCEEPNNIEIENCTGSYMIQDYYGENDRIAKCTALCSKNGVFTSMYFINDKIALNYEYNQYNFNHENLRGMIKVLEYIYKTRHNNETPNILKATLCRPKYDEKLKMNFTGCGTIIYIPKIDKYQCIGCYTDYILDIETNECKPRNNSYSYEICRKDLNNSCMNCYNSYNTLVTLENGLKTCKKDKEIENCAEAIENTMFINTLYNCTSCRLNYKNIYSKFYEREICQNVYEKIEESKNISLDLFNDEEYILAENSKCKDNYFTPDGKKCYKCDNKNVGMPGCKGKCNFSLDRNNIIKCEDKCKDGYIESSEGICELCEKVNEGCYECHYENDYTKNYTGYKRKRRFQCDYCKAGFYKKEDGECLKCSDYCEACEKKEDAYVCTKCAENFILNNYGNCQYCKETEVFLNDKCLSCDDESQGGVKGCNFCEKNEKGDSIICKLCQENFILFSNNNTCIERKANKELEQFNKCSRLDINNNKMVCILCKPEYSLLTKNNEKKCSYTPTLYDFNSKNYFVNREKYFIGTHLNLFPCKESINLGTEDNPNFSCLKCYNILENDDFYDYFNLFELHYGFNYDYFYDNYPFYISTKIIDSKTNISLCIQYSENLENCTEASYKIINGTEIYNCTKCIKNNILQYNKKLNMNYCTYNKNDINKCLVNYCMKCSINNNYFCSKCISSEYELNRITGSCVKKSEKIPAIIWKDIFRLIMNDKIYRNGVVIDAPSLRMRGYTSSQINKRHAFLIYLAFKITNNKLRYLEEKKIPAYCEIEDGVNEMEEDVSMVDYKCIGEESVEGELINIEEGDNDGILKKTNLKDIIAKTNFKNLTNKTNSLFTLDPLTKIITFKINKKNFDNVIYPENDSFNISCEGTINKNVVIDLTNFKLQLNEIDDKMNCDFNTDQRQNGYLKCELKLNNQTTEKNYTFKTTEFETKQGTVYIPLFMDIRLSKEKEENEGEESIDKEKEKDKEKNEQEEKGEKEKEKNEEKDEKEKGKEKDEEKGEKEKEKDDEEKGNNISSIYNKALLRNRKNSGLSTLGIVSIILAIVIALGIFGVIIYFFKFKKIERDNMNPGYNNETQSNINLDQKNAIVLNK